MINSVDTQEKCGYHTVIDKTINEDVGERTNTTLTETPDGENGEVRWFKNGLLIGAPNLRVRLQWLASIKVHTGCLTR